MSRIDEMDKLIVSLAVEKALVQMGVPELEKVKSILESKHNYKFEDCIQYPEILKGILCELYGYCYNEIFESILENLLKSSRDSDIVNFVNIMR